MFSRLIRESVMHLLCIAAFLERKLRGDTVALLAIPRLLSCWSRLESHLTKAPLDILQATAENAVHRFSCNRAAILSFFAMISAESERTISAIYVRKFLSHPKKVLLPPLLIESDAMLRLWNLVACASHYSECNRVCIVHFFRDIFDN